jgi:hypothetical protein
VQGWIDAGAHGRKLVSHTKEAGNLWQNLIGVVHEGLEADTHRVDTQICTRALGMALLLQVDLADIGGLFPD